MGAMISSLKSAAKVGFEPVRRKLKNLGVESDAEADAFLRCIGMTRNVRRGDYIIASGRKAGHSAVLLSGIACVYERLPNGSRQIYAFQYPGDFCDLNLDMLQQSSNEASVATITDSSIGILTHGALDEAIAQYPAIGLALWRAILLDSAILRKRLLNVGRQPALQRVAHLLCEQLARREAVGIGSGFIELNQSDLADAAGLSNVHINRTFKELQRQGLLLKEGRGMKVVNRERLAALGEFDATYLNLPALISRWKIQIEPPPPFPRT